MKQPAPCEKALLVSALCIHHVESQKFALFSVMSMYFRFCFHEHNFTNNWMRNLLKICSVTFCASFWTDSTLSDFSTLCGRTLAAQNQKSIKKQREITKFTEKNGSAVGFTMTSVDLIFAVHPGLWFRCFSCFWTSKAWFSDLEQWQQHQHNQ